ncbi:MAG: GNAT family N-acetyltransferase [Acidobacteriia bacterium]|nr:GNAT family N-acetyltransferase [Terriglobia bacterium]
MEPLGNNHDRAAFSCGDKALDTYLHTQAGQDVKKSVAVVFVATPDRRTIAGYYTLSQYAIHLDTIPPGVARKLPRYPMLPATLIGRLASSEKFRGQRVGETLLMNALETCLKYSKQVAAVCVVVDAKNDSAAAFYRKYGFIDLPKVERRLFLPMKTVAALFP